MKAFPHLVVINGLGSYLTIEEWIWSSPNHLKIPWLYTNSQYKYLTHVVVSSAPLNKTCKNPHSISGIIGIYLRSPPKSMLVREMPKEHAPPEMQWQKNRRTNCYRIRIVSVFELNIQSTYSIYICIPCHPWLEELTTPSAVLENGKISILSISRAE